MAILSNSIEFTGPIGNLSAYKMRGLNKHVLRTKGGASKKKILTSPSFKRTRENFTEFAQCGKMGGNIRACLLPLATVADYNFTSSLTSLSSVIQKLDTDSKRGERHIELSKHKHLLTGFSLTRDISFESMIRHPLSCSLDRGASKAIVMLPSLMPEVNLVLPKKYPLFRFIISLGTVSDRLFTEAGYVANQNTENQFIYTEWHHSAQVFEAKEIVLSMNYPEDIADNITLILSVGIQMGTPLTDAIINPAKYAGCGKIVAVA